MPNYESDHRLAAANKVFETEQEAGSRWTAIIRVAADIGCSPTTVRRWVRVVESERRPSRRRQAPASSAIVYHGEAGVGLT